VVKYVSAVADKLISYLDENIQNVLNKWLKKVAISEDILSSEYIHTNGLLMYELVKKAISHTVEIEEIEQLAYKLAQERLEARINIGEFVYNVNLGRSEIIKCIYSSQMPINELEQIIETVNGLFDKFSYYAVTKYTELKDLELQEKISFIDQSHQERLTILGQMASTFVHEFRNPLTAVLGFIKLIKSEQPDIKYLDIITHELNQLNSRISQFLHVSKKELIEEQESSFSLLELFEEIIGFLYASILDGEVSVSTDVIPSLYIKANKEELRQVFLNIILNSVDALKNQHKNREISIKVKVICDQIRISLSNNGPRIPMELTKTIFEPFYTTKEFGTGIGLFVCKRIIEKHKGQISCNSSDELTTFEIILPLSKKVDIE